jgi:poly-gamma-glutamate biosynthesis protein PgsC/CapC
LGIFAGLAWNRRTGWSCGGIITPGLLALFASSPWRVAVTIAVGVMLTPVLTICARAFGLYGKERTGAAMIIALGAHAVMTFLAPALSAPFDVRGVGWVVSGLIAADSGRQGVTMTVCGVVSCTLFTASCAELLRVL